MFGIGIASRSLIAPLAARFFTPTPTLAPRTIRALSTRLGPTCRRVVKVPIGCNRSMRFLHDKNWSDSPFPAGAGPSRSSGIIQPGNSRSFSTGHGGLGMSSYSDWMKLTSRWPSSSA
jgi:hypothetical protein